MHWSKTAKREEVIEKIRQRAKGRRPSKETRIKMSEKMRGVNNPNYRGGYYKRCLLCGKEFWVKPSRVNRKFCSRACYYKALTKIPEIHKRTVSHCKKIAKLGGQKIKEQRKDNPKWKKFLQEIAPLGGKTVIRKIHWKNRYSSFYDVLKIPVEEWLHRVGKGLSKHPNRLEKEMMEILSVIAPKFEFQRPVGKLLPDFTNEEEKKIIEVYGDYWHKGDDPQERIDTFRKYGYDCLIIWEHELKNKDKVIKEVKKFVGDNISSNDNRNRGTTH